MNVNWQWKLVQEQQRQVRGEMQEARLRREAGVPDRVPPVLKLAGVLLIALPFALLAARAVGKL